MNFVIRTVNILLIKFIGYYTESSQTRVIMVSIFVAQTLNTALLLLLSNANTQQTFMFWLPFNGEYPDLTFEWYNDIASSLVITMLTAAFMPLIEFCGFLAMRIGLRLLNRGFSFD